MDHSAGFMKNCLQPWPHRAKFRPCCLSLRKSTRSRSDLTYLRLRDRVFCRDFSFTPASYAFRWTEIPERRCSHAQLPKQPQNKEVRPFCLSYNLLVWVCFLQPCQDGQSLHYLRCVQELVRVRADVAHEADR